MTRGKTRDAIRSGTCPYSGDNPAREKDMTKAFVRGFRPIHGGMGHGSDYSR
jgi:hypothetical protein